MILLESTLIEAIIVAISKYSIDSSIFISKKNSAYFLYSAGLSLFCFNTLKFFHFFFIFFPVLFLSQSDGFWVSFQDILWIIYRFLICYNQMLFVLTKLQKSVVTTEILNSIINRIIILFNANFVVFKNLLKLLHLLKFCCGYLAFLHRILVAFYMEFQKSPIVWVQNLY